jgi:hypothetical protein
MTYEPKLLVEALQKFIEENSQDVFAFVENNRRPVEIGSENQVFGRLMRELVQNFPHCHCQDGPHPGHTEPDKTHYELAIAIIEAFWCSCLAQMKENRSAYPIGTIDALRSMIINSFDIARKYAPKEEERRQTV